MCQENDHHHEDEIDLVDILGVVIKRRRFIVWFIVCFTVLTSMLIVFREYKKFNISSKNKFTASNTLVTQNDSILASYIFLNKLDKPEGYPVFLNSLLFPAIVDAPTFDVQRVVGLRVNYLFSSLADAKNFSDKYNNFVDEVIKLKAYRNSMSEEVRASCAQFKSMAADSVKGAKDFFSNSKDLTNCNLYNYYFGSVNGKLRYATSSGVDDYYFPYIYDAIKDAKTSKLKSINDIDVADIKIQTKRDFDIKKVVKYSAFLFIFSIIVAFVMAFILEFWAKNKERISGYWR